MHITRLRLLGFKSFVDATELVVAPGLTGVVGPNGCGKSNLLEALRWVMGETSYKSMRAAAMDDVIFSGTTGRPARNMAEVAIFIDNTDRAAPAEFNDTDTLEISRRIEREAGSAYRINGREVRAKDVKILFEDAATGARSPALVRQGQIGEIVNAKPEQRRRILEDAAGTAGLHSRRHDAELRLKAADSNLVRLGDILGQMSSQMEGLKRQARQAKRYRELSDVIRRAEALVLYLRWHAASADVAAEETGLGDIQRMVAEATRTEAVAIKAEAAFSEHLQPLRQTETEHAAALARLEIERETLARDLGQAEARLADLRAEQTRLAADLTREDAAQADANEARQRIAGTVAELTAAAEGHDAAVTNAEQSLAAALEQLAETTGAHNALAQSAQAAAADRRARETEHDERQRACADLQDRAKRLDAERAELIAAAPQDDTGALEAQVADAETARGEAAEAIAAREQDLATRGQARDAAADAARTAAGDAAALTQEIATLERLLTVSTDESGDRAVDLITVADGFEKALAAALGDDLEAAVGTEAGTYWRALSDGDDYSGDPELPDGAAPLADRIEAPPELARRLRQIGLVDAADGADMQARLAPGQALISEAGDLWRWDGLVATASAPSPAAVRLAERNRLAALRPKLVAATAAAATAEADRQTKAAAAAKSASDLNAARAALSEREQAREKLRSKLHAGRQAQLSHETRLAALDDLIVRATDDLKAAQSRLAETTAAIADLPPQDHLAPQIEAAATALTAAQTKVAEDRTALATLKQAGLARDAQLATARNDDERWAQRLKSSADQIARLGERAEAVAEQLIHAQAHPGEIKSRQDKLAGAIAEAESARKTSADKLAEAETALRSATSALKRAQEAVAASREEKARAETRLDAARTRLVGTVQQIADTFETTPEACATLAQLDAADTANLPDIETSERKLQKLRSDRDRLGGVNLQAGEELETIEADYEKLDAERADVEDAVAKLRAGIAQLNREGRKRLQEAFTSVNREFSNLFRTLFGGGEAHLELIEGDDPLEGGLEIIAKPPGKKPTTLSLLSGGEQTLTALSLIFAVFLTNPSPICVLDEVDAPLDDANVDRFCTLMESMAKRTDTRFLVITHHPMTMSRMDRLFGVTMAERGVSQLVSVNLATAEEFLEAS